MSAKDILAEPAPIGQTPPNSPYSLPTFTTRAGIRMSNNGLTSLNYLAKTHSDSELVIGGAALLDRQLRTLLTASLLGSKRQIASLTGHYAQRRTLAYCIGLINREEFEDLVCVGQIRNHFAHDFPQPTFASECIGSLMGGLSLYGLAIEQGLDRRGIFSKTISHLRRRLHERLANVKRIKRR